MQNTIRTLRHIGWELIPWGLLCLIVVSTGAGFKIYQTAEETRASMVEVREASARVNRFLTDERLAEQHDRLVHSNDALQIMANTYSEVGYSTKAVIDDHVAPAIDLMSMSVDQRLQSIDREVSAFLDVASVEVGKNGQALYDNQRTIGKDVDQILANVDRGVVIINRRMDAREIDQILTDLAAAGHNVRVTTEDPEIRAALETIVVDGARTVANAANTTGNLDRTTADLDRYVNSKLFPKPPKGFWGKFKHGLKVTVEWAALGGNVLYPVVRLAR
jgi:hypothetical protein